MSLHLFSTKKLVAELAERRVTAEQQAHYLIVNSVFFSVLTYSGLLTASSPALSLPALLEFCVIVAISIVGIFRAYEAARGHGEGSFLVDFSCLFVPVSITTYLPVWVAYWAVRVSFTPTLISLSESHSQFAVNLLRMGSDFFGLLGFLATVGSLFISYRRVVSLLHSVQEQRRVHGG